ncbi:MAG: HAD-IC family P-type ATPase [Clostridiales bacterium]|nr:HAD-IC family P-type ATPase [Clostridiales bacterium]
MEQRQELPVLEAPPALGLTAEQVQQRLAAGWAAGAPRPSGKTEKEIILTHCFTFFNLIFVVLGVMLLVARSSVMNMGFLVVALINTAIGAVQEIRAKRAVDRLTLVAERPVAVIRDGTRQEVPPETIVRDDIAEFGQGDALPADGILREGELWLDESLVTGEADAVTRQAGDSLRSGSVVLAGRGRVQLTAVGEDSFAARLSREAKENHAAKKSEMMRSLDRLILWVGIALVPVGLILFYQEFSVLGLGLRTSVEGTVAALVGMIPEGLYLLTSIAMAASALKLSRNRVLVQDMNCIESLARVDVLCVDKTGTITEPDMEVEDLVPLADCPPEYLETVLSALYGGQEPDNATAKAIQELFHEDTGWVAEKRIPFSPETKWSGGIFAEQGAFLVGAPEFILGSRMEELREQVNGWTDRGSRVLLVASYLGDPEPGKLDPAAVTPLALVILSSRIRENAAQTFAYFAQQGVDIKVISGDDPRTVSQIAQRAGISGAECYLDASTLGEDGDYAQAARDNTVFGRVTPEQKRRLIAALQAQGHTVAMTGDGVNDLLAMKQADCSIGMASGAQAASQLASLVLLNSDFAAMPGIVDEGRRVINNIQRAASLFLVKNIFSLFLSVISLFTDWPYPLQPIHLTVISALTIGIPSFFLAMEPNYDRVRGHFLRGVLRRAFPGGLTNVFAVLLCQAFMDVFQLPAQPISTVCAGILAVVGMLVLFQVCKPFDRFRTVIWSAMLLGLLAVFTVLGDLFALGAGNIQTKLVMVTLLLMTPTVYLVILRTFDSVEKAYKAVKRKLKREKL